MENKENNELVKFKLINVDGEKVTKILPYNQYLALKSLCDGMAKAAEDMKVLAKVAIDESSNKKNSEIIKSNLDNGPGCWCCPNS